MLRLPANIIGDVGMMLAGSVEEQIGSNAELPYGKAQMPIISGMSLSSTVC